MTTLVRNCATLHPPNPTQMMVTRMTHSQHPDAPAPAHGTQAQPGRWRPVDLVGEPDPDTAAAIRTVISDWDGRNWAAVAAVLERTGVPSARIAHMNEMDVRMAFAVGQKAMIALLGGQPHTTSNTVIPVPLEQGGSLPGAKVIDISAAPRLIEAVHSPSQVPQASLDGALLSPANLLTKFALAQSQLNALNKRLQRYREKSQVGWIENTEAGSQEARFLYEVGAVRHILLALKATSGATSK